MGVPGKIIRPIKPEELEYMKWLAAHYVELAEKYVNGKFARLANPLSQSFYEMILPYRLGNII